MRTLPFIKYAPAGNTTILIPNVSLTAHERSLAAAEMLNPMHLGAEQVGYVNTVGPVPRLSMMGGEFCVNATRAMAAFLATYGLLAQNPSTGWYEGEVRVSGVDDLLRVRASGQHGVFDAAVRLTRQPRVEKVGEGVYCVRMPGITHLVLETGVHAVPSTQHEQSTKAEYWLHSHNLQGEDAAGVIWLDGAVLRITPVVWVRKTASLCLESACGSGTLAAACVLAEQKHHVFGGMAFIQPSGELLQVHITANATTPWHAWISGVVRAVAEGTVRVQCLEDVQTSDV